MTDEETNEWNRQNFERGMQLISEQSPRGIYSLPDASPSVIEWRNERRFAFLGGYVAHLLNRVEELEAKLAERE